MSIVELPASLECPPDPVASARAAGLRYVSNAAPGIRREPTKDGFRYLDPKGAVITDEVTLARIKALAIPPAWTAVWICPSPNGHIQATGRDARGRKQYHYRPRWRAVRDETKYDKLILFGEALPRIRAAVDADLKLRGLPRRKVLATVVHLLDTTSIREGKEEYARQNESYGLTTLRDDHVEIAGARVRFHFRGKSGKEHEVDLRDRRIATIVRRCRDMPGQELFQYVDDDGTRQTVDSGDVNDFLREIGGQDFTATDFRTWNGTVLASVALDRFESFSSETAAKRNVVQAVQEVAERPGNTPAVCRNCYIHPAVLDAYLDGSLRDLLQGTGDAPARHPADSRLAPDAGGEAMGGSGQRAARLLTDEAGGEPAMEWLRPEERALLGRHRVDGAPHRLGVGHVAAQRQARHIERLEVAHDALRRRLAQRPLPTPVTSATLPLIVVGSPRW